MSKKDQFASSAICEDSMETFIPPSFAPLLLQRHAFVFQTARQSIRKGFALAKFVAIPTDSALGLLMVFKDPCPFVGRLGRVNGHEPGVAKTVGFHKGGAHVFYTAIGFCIERRDCRPRWPQRGAVLTIQLWRLWNHFAGLSLV